MIPSSSPLHSLSGTVCCSVPTAAAAAGIGRVHCKEGGGYMYIYSSLQSSYLKVNGTIRHELFVELAARHMTVCSRCTCEHVLCVADCSRLALHCVQLLDLGDGGSGMWYAHVAQLCLINIPTWCPRDVDYF